MLKINFKKGDIVKVISTNSSISSIFLYKINDVGVITDISDIFHYYPIVRFFNGKKSSVAYYDLELITEGKKDGD